MAINFSPERLEEVKQNHEKWWSHELKRPLMFVTKRVKDSKQSSVPLLSQATCHDLSHSAEAVIDRVDEELSCFEYYGDAYPMLGLETFGPGVAAAFCGARLDNSSGAVWFYPPDEKHRIDEIHIKYDPNNVWAARVKDICAAGVKKWNGSVIVSFPDMGGTMDILASFCTTEELLYELYDSPDEVKRLIGEIHTAWKAALDDIAGVLGDANGGYTDWNGIYSRQKTHILQCDFSYMISPDMFEEFAMPEIRQMAKELGRVCYHLDGVGCLPNLNTLMQVEEIEMIQWVPGDGKPLGMPWIDTYRTILEGGKNAHIVASYDQFEEVYTALNGASGLYFKSEVAGFDPDRLKKLGF